MARDRYRLRSIHACAGITCEASQKCAQVFRTALAEKHSKRPARSASSVEPVQAEDRRDPRPAGAQARCRARAPARRAARHRSATSRARPAGAPRSPWHGAPTRSIQRSTDMGWRRSRKMREPHAAAGRRAPAAQAAARPARSLSAKDSTTTSPGVWPRSTGSTISSRLVELVASRCIAQPQSSIARRRRGRVPFSPMTTSRPSRGLDGGPGPIVVMRHARADRLHQEPHRLAGDGGKAFHAQTS